MSGSEISYHEPAAERLPACTGASTQMDSQL